MEQKIKIIARRIYMLVSDSTLLARRTLCTLAPVAAPDELEEELAIPPRGVLYTSICYKSGTFLYCPDNEEYFNYKTPKISLKFDCSVDTQLAIYLFKNT